MNQMMRVVAISLALVGCTQSETTGITEQGLCTIEDQSAGICAGPFTVLANHTRDVATENGGDGVDATVDCISGVAGQRFCSIAQGLLFCRLVVNCTLYSSGELSCDVGCF